MKNPTQPAAADSFYRICQFLLCLALFSAIFPHSAIAQNCISTPSNAISWWQSEGATTDALGANNGVLANGVTYGAGKAGQAFYFNGSNSYINLASPASLQLQNFTIEGWIKRSSSSKSSAVATSGLLFSYGNGGYGFGLQDNGSLFLSKIGTDTLTSIAAVTDATGFHHVAITKTNSTVLFYVDGVGYGAGAYNSTFQFTTAVAIGAQGDSQGLPFLGAIDELTIYGRALSGVEIQNLYAAGSFGKCQTGNAAITSQPGSQTVFTGDTASFSVGATGTPPLYYQWKFNQTNISQATNYSLILTNVQTNMAGLYSVIVSNVVSNVVNSVQSSNAILTVNIRTDCAPTPADIVGWWSAESNAIDNITAVSGAVGGGTTYGNGKIGKAFYFNGNTSYVDIASSAELQLQNFTIAAWVKRFSPSSVSQAAPNGTIFSYKSGGYGLGMFGDGTVYLTKAGVDSVSVSTGFTDTNNFHHLAVTKTNTTVVFYLDGVAFPASAYNAVFQFVSAIAIGTEGGDHLAPFYGAIDELYVYKRALSIAEIQSIYYCQATPVISIQPSNQIVALGANADFSVTADGAPPLYYQWKFNQTNITQATNATLTLTNVQTNQVGSYSVVISNIINGVVYSTLSSNASLALLPPPVCVTAPSNLVSWWSAESNAWDNIGGNNGMLGSNTIFGPGKTGKAFVFDGTPNSYVDIGRPANLQLQNFTIEAWIKRASSTHSSQVAANGTLFSYRQGGYGLGIFDNGNLYLTKAGVDSVSVSTSFTDTNNFHHVAVTKSNAVVIFYLDGAAFLASSYSSVFQFASSISIGAQGSDQQAPFYGSIDELSVYSRPLSGTEIMALYNARELNKCALSIPPSIYLQPASQTPGLGTNVTFSVGATGSALLAYQWNVNGVPINGATNSSLLLTNVQPTPGTSYSVSISNGLNQILSSNAVLKVNPVIQAINATASTARTVTVPINLIAAGNENTLQFSVNFNTNLLVYNSVSIGTNATSGFITANTNQLPNGRLGITVFLPSQTTFSRGTQQIAQITFVTSFVSNTVTTALSFGDQPTARQAFDDQFSLITAAYSNGIVTIPFYGSESDLSPRTNGDTLLSLADWQQAGKFVAGLDNPTNGNEFQRADSAPRAMFGDGFLTVADWVQAWRYATGVDPVTATGGPAQSVGIPSVNPSALRTLTIANASVEAGNSFQVAISLNSQGDENALGFGIGFQPDVLRFNSATTGSGTATSTFLVNTNQAMSGVVGIALELPALSTFAAGNREVAKLNFSAVPYATQDTMVSFSNQPVAQDVADSNANSLAVSYGNGLIAITNKLLFVSTSLRTNGTLALSWPASLTGFNLEGNTDLATTNWTVISSGLSTNAGVITAISSPTNSRVFYRLHHP